MWHFKAFDSQCMKPVLCRTLLAHMVPEIKWSLISWWHFFPDERISRFWSLMSMLNHVGSMLQISKYFTFLCHWQLKLSVMICSFSHTWLLMQESRQWGWVAEVPAGFGGSKQGYKFDTKIHFSASRTFLLEVSPAVLSDISSNRCVTSWKLLCQWAWPLSASAH